ncbi:MAG: alpha/beta fold hydrolase, partial [Bacteroidota bacterium]
MPEKILLPSTANKTIRRAYTDGPHGQIHYWTAGKGEALLLIHQSSSSQEEYTALVPYLAEDYFLIAYDWPGHGSSDDPDHELGVESYTESALHILDHLGISKAHVLGHHGGALLSMNLSYIHPERVS